MSAKIMNQRGDVLLRGDDVVVLIHWDGSLTIAPLKKRRVKK